MKTDLLEILIDKVTILDDYITWNVTLFVQDSNNPANY